MKTWLFLHLTGVSIWAGSILAVLFILLMIKKHLGSKELSVIVKRIIRIMHFLVHPSAVLVLVSGIFMIVTMGIDQNKPFWLSFMEKFGGVVVMFTIIAMSIAGRALVKRLSKLEGDEGNKTMSSKGFIFNSYIMTMAVSVVSIFSVILVVTFRF